MVIDSSALIAIISDEPDKEQLSEKLAEAEDPVISAATLLEVKIVAEVRLGPRGPDLIDRLLRTVAARVVAVDEIQAETAFNAWRRYGKGSHPAGLNYGDCFSYALAKNTDRALLFKGDDFTKTDLGPRSLTVRTEF